MEQAGLTPEDLQPMIGQSNRVYEVLNTSRALTLPMIRRLENSLGIPADALIGGPKARRVVGKFEKFPSTKLIKPGNADQIALEPEPNNVAKISSGQRAGRKTVGPSEN